MLNIKSRSQKERLLFFYLKSKTMDDLQNMFAYHSINAEKELTFLMLEHIRLGRMNKNCGQIKFNQKYVKMFERSLGLQPKTDGWWIKRMK